MDSIPLLKRCNKCGAEKPLIDFYTRKDSPDGRRKECKACFLVAQNNHYYNRPDRNQVLERMRDYSNNRYQNNTERREYQAKWLKEQRRNNPRVREMHLKWARAYKKHRRQNDRAYFLRERVRRHELAHRRRAAMRGSSGRYTPEQWYKLCAYYGHICLCCGEAKPLTPDHIVPLACGGSNAIENIQPLCLDCNRRKTNKTIDYRPKRYELG